MIAGTTEELRLADELGTVLARLNHLLRQVILPPGMSLAHGRTLATLRDLGPQRVTDLADREQVTQPTMSALVARMERHGWVQRRVDRVDRRVVLVVLTEAGREMLRNVTAARARLLRSWLNALSNRDRAALVRALPALQTVVDVAQQKRGDVLRVW